MTHPVYACVIARAALDRMCSVSPLPAEDPELEYMNQDVVDNIAHGHAAAHSGSALGSAPPLIASRGGGDLPPEDLEQEYVNQVRLNIAILHTHPAISSFLLLLLSPPILLSHSPPTLPPRPTLVL